MEAVSPDPNLDADRGRADDPADVASSPTLADDEARFAELSETLVEVASRQVRPWVRRCVQDVARRVGRAGEPELLAATDEAADRAAEEVEQRLRALMALDLDEQRTNPLSVLRGAVRHPTEVLRAAGVPPVRRDDFTVQRFPDDDYDLSPASFSDVADALAEPGLMWGAAKAHVHLRRRREGEAARQGEGRKLEGAAEEAEEERE
ncbi:MAG: hypothetical protein JJU45_00345 [Acidimicrobiia bacterium]|nr:hypothetical protein [Acidimicrobiia bacterium]